MRVIGDIPNPNCKITLYGWNGKYIVKIEQGPLEQTYKISEMDVAGEDDVRDMLNETFLEKVLKRFALMQTDWEKAMEEVED
ncbi:MAG: hypothetical protein LH606_09075 [Cytophagaceae bacterium]|nr:hypothetical protein [Cytophagaceae bacterium]